MMPYKMSFLTCLIFTLCTWELLTNMYRFMMPNKVTFVTCLMFTRLTLEFMSHMLRFMMSNKGPFDTELLVTLRTLFFTTAPLVTRAVVYTWQFSFIIIIIFSAL